MTSFLLVSTLRACDLAERRSTAACPSCASSGTVAIASRLAASPGSSVNAGPCNGCAHRRRPRRRCRCGHARCRGLRREAAGHDVEVKGITGDDIAGIGQHVRHLHAGAGDAVARAARREQQRFHRRDPDLDDVGENADLPRVPGGQQRDIGLRAQDDACLRRIRDRGLGAGVAAEDGCPCRQQERGQRQRATGAPELARTARGRGWSRRAGCALLGKDRKFLQSTGMRINLSESGFWE